MNYRSWLYVPGDSEEKLGNAVSAGADVIIADLRDAETKSVARALVTEWLNVHRKQITGNRLGRWVRVNSLDSGLWRDDLIAVMKAAPDGIILPRAAGPQDVQQLAAEVYEQEMANQIPSGSTRIIPLVGELPRAAMTIGAYLDASLPRLAGLAWGAEELSGATGATRRHEAGGGWTDAFRFVRAQVLLAAHGRGIMAIDTLHADHADERGLRTAAGEARADGFTGMLALHAEQVPVINEAFTPSDDDLDEARAIVAAFEASPGAGTLQVGQRTIDQPHLRLARRTLGMSEGSGAGGQPRAPILRPA